MDQVPTLINAVATMTYVTPTFINATTMLNVGPTIINVGETSTYAPITYLRVTMKCVVTNPEIHIYIYIYIYI